MRHQKHPAGRDLPHRAEQQKRVVVLRHITLGAGFDGAGGEDRVVVHAEDQDARLGVMRQNSPRQLEAGDGGKRYVDDRHIRALFDISGEAGVGVAGVEDLYVALAGQHGGAARDNDRVVVDDENAHAPPGARAALFAKTLRL